jgi:hypothetical protein
VSRDDRVKKTAGGQEDSRRSLSAVPRTRRSTPEVRQRRGPGRRREERGHFSLGMGLK